MFERLYDGVVGHSFTMDCGVIEISFIASEYPGKGNVSEYIEHLKKHYEMIKFTTVINDKLAGMLSRRGFSFSVEYDELDDAEIEVWTWKSSEESNIA